jgi:uncharacterized protein with PhoU and TrkA domain
MADAVHGGHPRNLKEILTEMKDTAELMIDLAYSAVMYDQHDIAEEVITLEEHMNHLQQQAYISLVLSGRNRQDAEQLVGVFHIVTAAEKISDAADDIATVVMHDVPLPDTLRTALTQSQEVTAKLVIADDSAADTTVHSFESASGTGTQIIALRQADAWQFNPSPETALRPDDTVFLRGPVNSVQQVYDEVGVDDFTIAMPDGDSEQMEELVDALIDMKDTMELATGLAYGAALFDSEEIADEVLSLESNADRMREHLETDILQTAQNAADVDELRGLYQIATASEIITDAAMEIAATVTDDIEPHPILQEANRESDESILRITVAPNSSLDSTTLQESSIITELGMTVMAVKQEDSWTYNPAADTTITAADTVILRGPADHRERVEALASST